MPANESESAVSAVATTEFVTSKDGTRIAFDRTGEGPPVILVSGALGNRSFPHPLGGLLAPHHTVVVYDRRGRNESGDTPPYATHREIEDIDALISEAGGDANVFGMSSGAVLALEAAASGLAVKKLVLYEPPLIVDDSRPPVPEDYVPHIKELIAKGRRGDAVEYFLTAAVRVPTEFVAGMRAEPMWPGMEAVAHTIPFDGAIMEGLMSGRPLPADRVKRWASYTEPTLVVDGGASEQFMHRGADALAKVMPNAQRRTLEGQTHDVNAEVLAPVLIEFFQS
jgi:pimeloyl-ACP methyl ester carboxylesterase